MLQLCGNGVTGRYVQGGSWQIFHARKAAGVGFVFSGIDLHVIPGLKTQLATAEDG